MQLTATRFITALSFVSLLVTGCASEGDEVLGEEELAAGEEEELAASSEELAALPTLALFVNKGCAGNVFRVSGEARTNAPPAKVTFTISGGTHPIPAPGGYFAFNPGGSGTLKAKACNSAGCTTRSNPIQWISCGGSGPDL